MKCKPHDMVFEVLHFALAPAWTSFYSLCPVKADISRASGPSMLFGISFPSWLPLPVSTVNDPAFYVPPSHLCVILWLTHFLQITWPSSLRKHGTWFLEVPKVASCCPLKYVSLWWSPQPCQSRHVHTPSHLSFVGSLSSLSLGLPDEIQGTQLNWNFR